MAYNLAWGSNHPGHLVYLIDLSQSMAENQKIDNVIETIYQVSNYLVAGCFDEVSQIYKDRFTFTIIGYNSDIVPLFKGSAIELDKYMNERSNSRLPFFDKNNEAKPQWQTYTEKGFKAVADDIKQWIDQQEKNNIPTPAPIVIHITDGYPYEQGRNEKEAREAALKAARDIMSISVPDGNVLLFNIHIEKGEFETLSFPNVKPDDVQRQFLYDASSVMTDEVVERAQRQGLPAKTGSHFMVSNESDKYALAKLVVFGSSIPNNVEPPKM